MFVSLELSILIPVPAESVLARISVPVVFPIKTPPGVIPVGVSLSAVKLIVPP